MSSSSRQSQATTTTSAAATTASAIAGSAQDRHRSQLSSGAGTGLRVPSNGKTIYDRNPNRSRNAELSKASFAFLFSEMITYAQRRVTGIQDLERRRTADALEHSISPDTPNEYMITDNDPLVNTYISVPKEMNMLNCAAYVAGIIEGVCDGCGFEAKVSAHNQSSDMWPCRTVFLIRFGESVMEREKMLDRQGIK
ncbi:TRAPP subunit trs31 [Ascosphaera aggregata]|nr:TRAPP subunit trs31 [Ascosphaera aggregata]